MDSKENVHGVDDELTSYHHSSSPGSFSNAYSIRVPPSSDSEGETSAEVTYSSMSSDNTGSAIGSGSEQGFISGPEEFETASERTLLCDADEESSEKEASEGKVEAASAALIEQPVESGVNLRARTSMPIAKVTIDDDEEYDEVEIESPQAAGFNTNFAVENGESFTGQCLKLQAADTGSAPPLESNGHLEDARSKESLECEDVLPEDHQEVKDAVAGSSIDLLDNGKEKLSEGGHVHEVMHAPRSEEMEGDGGAIVSTEEMVEPLAVSEENAGIGNGTNHSDCPVAGEEADTLRSIHEEESLNRNEGPVNGFSDSIQIAEVIEELKFTADLHADRDGDFESEGSTEDMIFGNAEIAQQFLADLENSEHADLLDGRIITEADLIDGQIVTDSDEGLDTDDGNRKEEELFDANALAVLLKAVTGNGEDGGITLTTQDGSRVFSLERPAGLGGASSLQALRPAVRPTRPMQNPPPDKPALLHHSSDLTEEEKRKLEKIHKQRVTFLRLVRRLGYTHEDSITQQVLYKLALAAGKAGVGAAAYGVDAAKNEAARLEEEKADLDFNVNILVIGKTGVGKSATVNSIFGEERTPVDPFNPATARVAEIAGAVDGVTVRVLDTPGLRPSLAEHGFNARLLRSVKKAARKCPPDVVLYVDRLDMPGRDNNDLPLLRSVTGVLGSSLWRNSVVTLTHAASAPPDGPMGGPMSYEMAVSQRAHVVQQAIGHAVGDLRLMNPTLMNPVTLVENHHACRKNRDGQKVLPSGQSWRPQLLLLCYSMKILSDAVPSSAPADHRKLFGFRLRSPPLPYLLSNMLQPRKAAAAAATSDADDADSDDGAASDDDGDDEYDQLPPFKPLRKSQIAKLGEDQRRAYLDEYDYRAKLLQKKLWKEEARRMKRAAASGSGLPSDVSDDVDSPAAVPVALPDMALPPSFDGDGPAYRYRFLEPSSGILARPVLDTHGWDHDCGYDGVSLERSGGAGRFPVSASLQITKDKKEFHVQMDSSVSAKHGDSGSTAAGFEIQNMGKQLAYVVRGETRLRTMRRRNRISAGGIVTLMGETVAPGFKVEDRITLGRRLVLMAGGGVVRCRGDGAYGANFEVRLRNADYPIDQDGSALSLSLVKWRGDLAIGSTLQSQFSVCRGSRLSVRAALNNKRSGQISIRTTSSDHVQVAVIGLVPLAVAIYRNFWPGASQNYSIY